MNREEAIQKAERALNDPIAKGGSITLLELDHLRVLLEALRGPWVKTADRLPDDNKPVLVTYVGYTDNLPHNDAIAVYAHEKADNYAGAWYWQDSDGVDDNPVSVSITHWMPVPPLPEVGE